MNFDAFIFGLMLVALVGCIADFIHVGLRRFWRYHQHLRSIRRTARLCRLYGFVAPSDDERSSLYQFRQHIKR